MTMLCYCLLMQIKIIKNAKTYGEYEDEVGTRERETSHETI